MFFLCVFCKCNFLMIINLFMTHKSHINYKHCMEYFLQQLNKDYILKLKTIKACRVCGRNCPPLILFCISQPYYNYFYCYYYFIYYPIFVARTIANLMLWKELFQLQKILKNNYPLVKSYHYFIKSRAYY